MSAQRLQLLKGHMLPENKVSAKHSYQYTNLMNFSF